MFSRDISKKKYQPKKLTYHDKERNRKIHRSAHRIDCIGDTDGTGSHIVYGPVKTKRRSITKMLLLIVFVT